jgi:hypothetical protein
VNERQDNWDELLAMGEFTYNNHVHASTQQTPFMVDTGRHLRMGLEPRVMRSRVFAVNKFAGEMVKGLEEAKAVLTKAKDEYVIYYNRRHIPAPVFKPSDMVWLDSSDIHTTCPSAKLADKHLGPYPVERNLGHGSYRLHLPYSMSRLYPVFPVTKLELYPGDPIAGCRANPPPPPVLVDGEARHEVEKILDSRT